MTLSDKGREKCKHGFPMFQTCDKCNRTMVHAPFCDQKHGTTGKCNGNFFTPKQEAPTKQGEDITQKAHDFAVKKHGKTLDDSGLPYINHPITVASLIRMVSNDENLISAAYLHDTIEDTETTYDELVREFNQDIADLVMEVTHEGKKDNIGYYFPRLKTQRGIMLKFADRLCNLSRMEPWTEERRKHYLKRSKFWKSELRSKDQEAKDYVVVKDYETSEGLVKAKQPKSLQGKYIIVAPKGLKFVSKEDIAKLPQVKALIDQEADKRVSEAVKEIETIVKEMLADFTYPNKEEFKVNYINRHTLMYKLDLFSYDIKKKLSSK